MKIKRYRPLFFTGFPDEEYYVNSKQELLDSGLCKSIRFMKVIKECNGLADEIRIGMQSPFKKDRYDVKEFEMFVEFLHRLVHFEDFSSMLTLKRSLCKQADYMPSDVRQKCAALITEI